MVLGWFGYAQRSHPRVAVLRFVVIVDNGGFLGGRRDGLVACNGGDSWEIRLGKIMYQWLVWFGW